MALSQSTVIGQLRTLVAQVTGLNHVYAPSETDANRLPEALNDLPCAIVMPGQTVEYILSPGQHRHTYKVGVRLYAPVGGDLGEAGSLVLPMTDRLIEKFALNVGLGGRTNAAVFESSSGFTGLEWGGIEYLGIEVTLRVSEQASASPAIGA